MTNRQIWRSMLPLLLLSLLVFVCAVPALAGEVFESWDDYTSEGRMAIFDSAISEFLARHPDLEFERTIRPLKELTTMVLAAVPTGNVPDIMLINNGETMMGPLQRGGYVVPLDSYAEQYGWIDNLFSASLWDRNRYSPDGLVMGEGDLLAVSFDGELVGVFYNKDIFRELGIEIPSSLPEFEESMDKMLENGVDPIAYAGLTDYRFFHLFAAIQCSYLAEAMGADAAQEYLNDIALRWSEERSLINEANIKAAEAMQRWAQAGYLMEGFEGIGGNDDLALFLAGEAAMFVQGSWFSTEIANADFEVGFFLFPPLVKGGELPPQTGGITTPIGIPANAANPDLSAEFLDILIASEKNLEIQLANAILPAVVPVDLEHFEKEKIIEKDTVYHDLLVAWNQVNEVDRVAPYFDWTTPTMWDTLIEAGRSLLAGRITGEQFIEQIEEDYRHWLENKPGANN